MTTFTVFDGPFDVEFRIKTDAEGDVVLYANGRALLYIRRATGMLCRFVRNDADIESLSALAFDKDGRIVVSGA